MSKYRPQIRADLQEVYGVDLGVWLSENRWHALHELITQLPTASRFQSAMVNDEEIAELMLEAEDAHGDAPRETWAPPFEDYTTTNRLISELINDVRSLLGPLVALAGGKPPGMRPMPVPRTALEKVRERRDIQDAIDLACLFGFTPEDFA